MDITEKEFNEFKKNAIESIGLIEYGKTMATPHIIVVTGFGDNQFESKIECYSNDAFVAQIGIELIARAGYDLIVKKEGLLIVPPEN